MTGRRLTFPLIVVVALAIILSAYYVVHKPFAPAQAAALGAVLADLGAASFVTLAGGGVGRTIFRSFLRDGVTVSAGERVALHLALGWGALGMAMLALGLAGLFYSILIWAGLLILLLAVRRDAWGWLRDLVHALRGLWFPDRFSRFAALFVIFTLALGLLRALAPPLKWDALVYHLTLPKLYAQTHGVRLADPFFFSGMPQLAEMLYTAAVLLRGPVAAQTLGWTFGAALALGLAAYAHTLLEARSAALAPAILFSSFTVAVSLAWAYADVPVMLFALACLIALRGWRASGQTRWLTLAAVCAGFAMGCKYTGALVPLAGAAVVFFEGKRQKAESTQSVTRSSIFSFLFHPSSFILLACAVFSPWLLKNWLFTGSPTYPLLLPAADVDALRLQFYNQPDLAERNPLWAALIFFRAVFLGVQGGNDHDATLSPLLVLLPFGLALGWRGLDASVRNGLRPLALFVLAGYAGWVILTFTSAYAVQARLFFAIFPALALLGAGGLAASAALDVPGLRSSWIVSAALALVLSLSAVETAVDFCAHAPLAYLAGAQTAADYRAANLGWYAAAIARINALPSGSRVLFLWEPRSLDCAAPDRCVPDLIIDRWWHLRRTGVSSAAALADWQARGVTHVLIYDGGVKFLRERRDIRFVETDWTELENLRAQMRLVEDLGGTYSLYTPP